MLAKAKRILTEWAWLIDAMLHEQAWWLKRRRLQTERDEELQFQRDLQYRIDSMSEHLIMSDERLAQIDAELAAMGDGVKMATPPTKENDHASHPG